MMQEILVYVFVYVALAFGMFFDLFLSIVFHCALFGVL